MKNFISFKIRLIIIFSAISILSGCYGNFALTKKLYKYNSSVSDKFARSALTWVFIIPYGLAGTLDFVFFNTYEFWAGKSLISSQPSVVEKIVRKDGTIYRITVSPVELKIEKKTGNQFKHAGSILYNPKQQNWLMKTTSQERIIAEPVDEHIAIYTNSGKVLHFDGSNFTNGSD